MFFFSLLNLLASDIYLLMYMAKNKWFSVGKTLASGQNLTLSWEQGKCPFLLAWISVKDYCKKLILQKYYVSSTHFLKCISIWIGLELKKEKKKLVCFHSDQNPGKSSLLMPLCLNFPLSGLFLRSKIPKPALISQTTNSFCFSCISYVTSVCIVNLHI